MPHRTQGARMSKTTISIHADAFHINDRPTYEGRYWHGHKVEGLLLNTRMVQATFDDTNPATVQRWAYPDTGRWDPERNIGEFLDAMPTYRDHGVLAMTLNLQGGSPEGYSKDQPWHNSAIAVDGTLRDDYMNRFARILDRADELGMVIILGLFYFGQDDRVQDEDTVCRAVDHTVDWLLARNDTHVLIEVDNECNVARYTHEILKPHRVHELVRHVREYSAGKGASACSSAPAMAAAPCPAARSSPNPTSRSSTAMASPTRRGSPKWCARPSL